MFTDEEIQTLVLELDPIVGAEWEWGDESNSQYAVPVKLSSVIRRRKYHEASVEWNDMLEDDIRVKDFVERFTQVLNGVDWGAKI